ncbi:MAG: hypothetical protein ACRC8T_06945 [Acidaminococcaceae bacterium]
MENVYDIIADFYDHDENWNMLLRREYAEGYIRQEAWKGLNDRQLQKQWEQIMMLCLYLGYAETFLGDMTDDDFIDAVAWCGRNVSEFKISYDNVKLFLDTCAKLFIYLKSKNAITRADAPAVASERILGDGAVLRVINENGVFLPGEGFGDQFLTPNAPVKIFLNIGDMLQQLLDELHAYFQDKAFNLDLERAVFLYHGIFPENQSEEVAESDEFWQCFWDYFLFDYHLLADDKTPIEHFYAHGSASNKELVAELMKARLAIFSVNGINEDNMYICTDFFTGEKYALNLPIEEEFNTKDMLFVGHCFYNNTMVMNYVRCLKIGKLASKRLIEMLKHCYERYKIQEPNAQWKDFVSRHPMLVRHLTYIYSFYVKLDGFAYETNIEGYQPPDITVNDEVAKCIKIMMKSYHFSCRDINLATRLWKDFSGHETNVINKPEVLASGVIENFVRLNGVYNYTEEKVAEMCWEVPVSVLRKVADKIKTTLHIEKYDPRYCNEEGFLLMMFSS